jgi:MinD superfamily P-loop ATPase
MKITIASGKGGTGKTTLSTNLAIYLKNRNKDVVLVDLDVEEPNVTQFLKGELKNEYPCTKLIPRWDKNSCTLCKYCSEVCNFNAIVTTNNKVLIFNELCHSCFACSELCPTASLFMEPIKVGTILNSLKLFDAPPGTSCSFIEACRQSDFIVLVTEPTPFGLNDLKLAVETLKVIKKEFAVVINRDGIGNSEVEDYCNDKGIEIIAKIKNDINVAKLYSQGKIVYKEIEHFKKSLEEICSFLGEIR